MRNSFWWGQKDCEPAPPRRCASTERAKAGGSVSIEFASTFVLLIAVFYGTAGYVTPLLLSTSYQDVAASGLREAVMQRYEPLPNQTISSFKTIAKDSITRSWLPPEWARPCEGYGDDYLKIDEDTWTTCLRHPSPRSLLPSIYIPIVDAYIPPLPEEIKGEAALQLPPHMRLEEEE